MFEDSSNPSLEPLPVQVQYSHKERHSDLASIDEQLKTLQQNLQSRENNLQNRNMSTRKLTESPVRERESVPLSQVMLTEAHRPYVAPPK